MAFCGRMATGAVPISFAGLKSRENGLGFGKNVDFVRVSDLQRVKSRRTKVSVIRNSSSVEVQPASEGSPLLGGCSLSIRFHLDFSNLIQV